MVERHHIARIYWSIAIILILSTIAILYEALTTNIIADLISDPTASHIFNLDTSQLPIPLSVAPTPPQPISCTVTNLLYYFPNGVKTLYGNGGVAKTQYLNLIQGGATTSPISAFEATITLICQPIPSFYQQNVNYQQLYLTGGNIKDTFCITTGQTCASGQWINQDSCSLPNNGLAGGCGFLSSKQRVDGTGVITLYDRTFTSQQVQNLLKSNSPSSIIIDNDILYTMAFQIYDNNGNLVSGGTWTLPQWGNSRQMQLVFSGNGVQTQSNVTPSSTVENLVWSGPQNVCTAPYNTGFCIDLGQQSTSLKTLTFQAVLPQYRSGESPPTANVYYTDTVNGITNTNPVFSVTFANPTISTDGTNTATFTATIQMSQVANVVNIGTWKIQLVPALGTNGQPFRTDPNNNNQIYFSVMNSATSPGTPVCTPPSVVQIVNGNQRCVSPTPSGGGAQGGNNANGGGGNSTLTQQWQNLLNSCPYNINACWQNANILQLLAAGSQPIMAWGEILLVILVLFAIASIAWHSYHKKQGNEEMMIPSITEVRAEE
jgi:hypothetical protein